jgi:hypothetical protein
MTRHSPLKQFKQAKQIAQDHGLFIVDKPGDYRLYRKMALRIVFIGKRSTPEALYTLVCKATNFH